MKDDKNLQTSTIRVPKKTLEKIKIYCRKNGRTIGEWADLAQKFIEKNDFDIFDEEVTPSLPVPPAAEQRDEKYDALLDLLSKFVLSVGELKNTPQLPSYDLDKVSELAEERANAQAKLREQEKDIKRLEGEIKRLESDVASLTVYKENAYRELCRVRDNQKTFGKIEVKTEF